MRLAVYTGLLIFCAVSLLQPLTVRSAQKLPGCLDIVTPEDIRKNDWISFQNGRVLRIDRANGLLAVELDGVHYGIHFDSSTLICHAGKPGTLRELKVGDRIGGFTKIIKGRSMAVILGYGDVPYAIGLPVPGRAGWVRSPYAPTKEPFDVTGVPAGAMVTCPYTGKIFKNP